MAQLRIFFGPFQLDLEAGLLCREGTPIPLRPKTWAVLCCLVENAGRLISKNDLLDRVWGSEAVTDTIVGISVAELRRALADDARHPRYIETAYGRGFRFVGAIQHDGPAPAIAAVSPPAGEAPDVIPAATATEASRALVGRATELARLHAFIAEPAGDTRVFLLAGEAGIGKTSLLNAALAEIVDLSHRRPVAIGRGQCPPYVGAGYPFVPITSAIKALCRHSPTAAKLLRRHAPSWSTRLHPAAEAGAVTGEARPDSPSPLDPAELIALARAVGPLVLAFEDLHWADHATLDFIVAVAEHPDLTQCRVIGTYRPAEAIATKHPIIRARREMERHRRAAELVLGGLDQAGVAAYLCARLSATSCSDSLAIDLLARTSGNPLFLSVSIDHLAEAGAFELSADGKLTASGRYASLSKEIPDSLREMVLQRFADESDDDQALLASASVVGFEAEAAAIAAAMNEPVATIDAACTALARGSSFLRRSGESLWPDGVVSGRYTFRHPLYQRVLYDQLAPAVRAESHRRIAAALVAGYGAQVEEVAGVIANHFDCSHKTMEAIDYYLTAGRAAAERHASRDALNYLHRAHELQKRSGGGEREAVILNQLAKTLPAVEGLTGADFAASFARARSLNAGSADIQEGVITLVGLAVATLVRNKAAAAESLTQEIIELAATREDPTARLAGGLIMGAVLYHQGDIASALEYLALDFSDAEQDLSFGPIDLRAACAALQTPILWQAGRPDEALLCVQAALARADAGPHPLNLVFARQAEVVVRHLRGERECALVAAVRLRSVAEEQGIAEASGMAALMEAAIRSQAAEEKTVVALVEAGLVACDSYGAVLSEAYLMTMAAEALIAVGQLTRAAAMLDKGQAMIAAGAARFWEPEIYRLRGELCLLDGENSDRSAADEHFASGQRIAAQQGSKSLSLRCALSRGRLWQDEGQARQAQELVATALNAIEGGTATGDVIAAHTFLANV
ncbi:MAG TPA: AAA family ATPase [Terriglobales bacterium]|nr:AAA family ATPase [Terriglobales bacterium]